MTQGTVSRARGWAPRARCNGHQRETKQEEGNGRIGRTEREMGSRRVGAGRWGERPRRSVEEPTGG